MESNGQTDEEIRTIDVITGTVINAETGKPAKRLTILPGDTFITSTGRFTTPYPKYSKRHHKGDIRKTNQWLIDNAVEEAEQMCDDFNLTVFSSEAADNLPTASAEAMYEYIFGEKPAICRKTLKHLI
jgi:hypothetical protein